jgi:alkaline phosphatase
MDTNLTGTVKIGRRAFLGGGTLLLASGLIPGRNALAAMTAQQAKHPKVRFGVITDLHYADKPPAGTRYYRETPAKLAETAERFRLDKPDFLVELGDLIDSADSLESELGYLKRINRDVSAITERRHYVLGNHCVQRLTKAEFLGTVEQERSFYSFDSGGHHFVVLDACFRSDGEPYGRLNSDWKDANVPAEEVEWLRADLADNPKPTVVFVHQRLDVGHPYGVGNAPEIRKALEGAGQVQAVFQGHSHKNDYKEIAGIHYVTLVAMIEGSGAENNGYATVTLDENNSIQVQGFRKQKNYSWNA